MTFVILQHCCNEASCVDVCPADCIHPRPSDPKFMNAEMLHIDPANCIDCGACVDACPVGAIKPDYELTEGDARYLEINAEYFDHHPTTEPAPVKSTKPSVKPDYSGLRVAIVGTGPAGFYAAAALLQNRGVEVTMFDRLLTPYGLVRCGVAPDHLETKSVTDVFRSMTARKTLHVKLGVTIGKHLTHEDLLAHHHAVIYAVGASRDRRMNIPGEDLPGSHSAAEFVGWYNGHPDFADRTFNLSSERAVVVGNGNVALDIARILLSDDEYLERRTDIAEHALKELRKSSIREVVVVGRRGRAQAAYTNPEILALIQNPHIGVVVDADSLVDDPIDKVLAPGAAEPQIQLKVRLATEIANSGECTRNRVVLRFLSSPSELIGVENVEAIRLDRNRLRTAADGSTRAEATGETSQLATGLVLRSIGFAGTPLPGLPFDQALGVIPNVDGRVLKLKSDEVLPGVYVSGWVKRGPSGVIGTNRKCSTDTVSHLLEDYAAGLLLAPTGDRDSLDALLSERAPGYLDMADWNRIDKAERAAGIAIGRPRVKFVSESDIREATQV